MSSPERNLLSMRIPEQHEGIVDPLGSRLGELPGVEEVFYVPTEREIKVLYQQDAEIDKAAVEEAIRQVVDHS